jgi:hypothetical protein
MTWDTIFKAGKHTSSDGRTRDWTNDDLDKLVKNTTENPDIVIHHPADQDKAHKFGKIDVLRRINDKLQAKYKDVPEILTMAVKEGLRLAKSVSIDPVAMKIRHVGLLGADQPPAVEGLGPASFSASSGDDTITYLYTQTKEEPSVDPKETKIKELENQVQTLTSKLEGSETQKKLDHAQKDLKDEKEAHQKTKDEFSAYKKEREEKALESRVTALVDSGRIEPTDKDDTIAFAKNLPDADATMDFSKDGKTEKVSPREKYLRGFEAREPKKNSLLSEFASSEHAGRKQSEDIDMKDVNNYA